MVFVMALVLGLWLLAGVVGGVFGVALGVLAAIGSVKLIMVDYRYTVPITLILWVLVLGAVGWAAVVFAVLAIFSTWFLISHLRYRFGSPWRRMYFPLLGWYQRRVAAFLVGHRNEPEQDAGAGRLPKLLLPRLLQEVDPSLTRSEAEIRLAELEADFATWFDSPWMKELAGAVFGREPTDEEIRAALQGLNERGEYNSYFVRFVLGELIGERLGDDQKRDYWTAVIKRQV